MHVADMANQWIQRSHAILLTAQEVNGVGAMIKWKLIAEGPEVNRDGRH